MLLAVAVLAALVEIAVARSVPALHDVPYVIEADGKEAVIDATGQYVVETESETDFEDLRAKRREFICPENYNLRMRNTELRFVQRRCRCRRGDAVERSAETAISTTWTATRTLRSSPPSALLTAPRITVRVTWHLLFTLKLICVYS